MGNIQDIAIKCKAYGNQSSPFLLKTDGYILDNNSQVLTGQGIELILPPGKVSANPLPPTMLSKPGGSSSLSSITEVVLTATAIILLP
jgi:hypothetical protein